MQCNCILFASKQRVVIYACYGITNTCPTLIVFTFEILFAEAIAATVVPYLTAIAYNESPDLTVYVLGDEEPLRPPVEPASPSAGIATATGTANESPDFNN